MNNDIIIRKYDALFDIIIIKCWALCDIIISKYKALCDIILKNVNTFYAISKQKNGNFTLM